MEEPTQPLPLSVLLYVESGYWIAQCLEYDVCEQGGSIDVAVVKLSVALAGHMSGPIDLVGSGVAPDWRVSDDEAPPGAAPDYFRACWETAHPLAETRWGGLILLRVANEAVGPVEARIAAKHLASGSGAL
jgi:hypothetical protein